MLKIQYCLKSVPIQSFSGPYFPAFGLMELESGSNSDSDSDNGIDIDSEE